ncbi:carbohydrate ABC transporter permease [Xylanimonas sp. McL0601]|uniref:carbohydrate ABC transporter permease n=1 Tax=Xylanimonas sp. McL0601 TaxID=3414739 RepID=UPI003CF4BFCA
MTTTSVRTPAAPARQPGVGTHKLHKKPKNDLRVALAFVAPATFGFAVFYLWPALRGIYFSFTEYSIMTAPTWVGLENFRKIVDDATFWNAMKVTLEYVVINIGVQTVVALGIAVLMQRLTRSLWVRGILLTPYLVANVIVALVWFWMLDYNIGIVNTFLEWVGNVAPWSGIGRTPFFGDEAWAIPTIALVNTWRHAGYTALLIFAGLQTIPAHLYEAAAIDGAGEVRSFFKITLPLLRPVMAMVLVITITGSFQVFDTVAVTTGGGPVIATKVIQFYIWEEAFTKARFGYASALSVVLLVILAVLALFQLKLMRADKSDLA